MSSQDVRNRKLIIVYFTTLLNAEHGDVYYQCECLARKIGETAQTIWDWYNACLPWNSKDFRTAIKPSHETKIKSLYKKQKFELHKILNCAIERSNGISDLAKKIGVRKSVVDRWVVGAVAPTIPLWLKILKLGAGYNPNHNFCKKLAWNTTFNPAPEKLRMPPPPKKNVSIAPDDVLAYLKKRRSKMSTKIQLSRKFRYTASIERERVIQSLIAEEKIEAFELKTSTRNSTAYRLKYL